MTIQVYWLLVFMRPHLAFSHFVLLNIQEVCGKYSPQRWSLINLLNGHRLLVCLYMCSAIHQDYTGIDFCFVWATAQRSGIFKHWVKIFSHRMGDLSPGESIWFPRHHNNSLTFFYSIRNKDKSYQLHHCITHITPLW